MKILSILAALLVFGCSSEKETKCKKYADMEIKCGGYPADEQAITRKMADGFCQEALGGDDLLNLGQEIECAQKHSDCSSYSTCAERD